MNPTLSFRQKIALVISGLILCMFILEICLRLAGFIYLSLQERRNKTVYSEKGAYRILCLGDSNTALGGSNSYPSQLERILNQRLPERKFVVINKGIPGASTNIILSQLKDNLDRYAPDMVITMMGESDIDGVLPIEERISANIKKFIRTTRFYKLVRLLEMRLSESRILHKKYLDLGEYYSGQQNYYQSEEMFKSAIKIYPDNWEDYIRLGYCYSEQCKYSEAKEMFRKAIEINPECVEARIALGICYSDDGEYPQAEEMLKRTIEINPSSLEAHIALGICYSEQEKYAQAEEIFKHGIAIEPEGGNTVCLELAQHYQQRKMFPQEEEMLKRAIEINANSLDAHIALGWCYSEQEKYAQAEEIFKHGIIIEPEEDNTVYLALAQYYQERNMYPQAEEICRKGVEINPNNECAYRCLALLDQLKGRTTEAELYLKKAEFMANYCKEITRRNYQRLKDVVLRRGIKLVCAAYPVCSRKSLMLMFDNSRGAIFVDNETIFREELKKAKYEDYFVDRYGGEFGHCTAEGNRLLAENIAETIIGEYFGKKK